MSMNKQNYEYILNLECLKLKEKLNMIKNREVKIIRVCRNKNIYLVSDEEKIIK